MIFDDTDGIFIKNDEIIRIDDPHKICKLNEIVYDVYNTKRKRAGKNKNFESGANINPLRVRLKLILSFN